MAQLDCHQPPSPTPPIPPPPTPPIPPPPPPCMRPIFKPDFCRPEPWRMCWKKKSDSSVPSVLNSLPQTITGCCCRRCTELRYGFVSAWTLRLNYLMIMTERLEPRPTRAISLSLIDCASKEETFLLRSSISNLLLLWLFWLLCIFVLSLCNNSFVKVSYMHSSIYSMSILRHLCNGPAEPPDCCIYD